jgi:hypothetical protein
VIKDEEREILFMTLFKSVCLSLFAVSAFNACAPSSESDATASAPPAAETLCYQQVTGEGENQDISVVVLNVKGESAEGSYDWLPAFKDHRKGTFKGTRKAKTITADYTYSQEGVTETTSITLVQEDAGLTISGGPPELGLSAQLPVANCAELTEKV